MPFPSLEVATGTGLDYWAALHDLKRGDFEPDILLRDRILIKRKEDIKKMATCLYGTGSTVVLGEALHSPPYVLDEVKENMTLIIYYDNGKSYTAKHVTEMSLSDQDLVYEQEINDRGVRKESTIAVPLHDVMAYVIKREDETKIVKLKPCASVKLDIVKT